MTLQEIAELVQKGVSHSGFAESLKFDCGAAGQLVIRDGQVGLDDQDTDCTLKLSLDNLGKLVQGKLNPMTAVMTGKLKVSGNPTIALKLKELL